MKDHPDGQPDHHDASGSPRCHQGSREPRREGNDHAVHGYERRDVGGREANRLQICCEETNFDSVTDHEQQHGHISPCEGSDNSLSFEPRLRGGNPAFTRFIHESSSDGSGRRASVCRRPRWT